MSRLGELVQTVLTPYVVVRNAVDYPLRRWLRFPRPVRQVEPAGLEVALAGLDEAARREAGRLIERYGLDDLARRGRRRDVLENLYYVELIATALERGGIALPAGRIEAADVGVSDWFYAAALAGVLRHWRSEAPRSVRALGFESDPGRRYADGHTREDWAAWYTEDVEGLEYRPEDARRWRGEADLALMLFPFVFVRDADRWGLPRGQHDPAGLLAHVWERVRPGGGLVVANQGERERDEQRRLFARVGIEPAWSGRFESAFWSYPIERWVHAAVKR